MDWYGLVGLAASPVSGIIMECRIGSEIDTHAHSVAQTRAAPAPAQDRPPRRVQRQASPLARQGSFCNQRAARYFGPG